MEGEEGGGREGGRVVGVGRVVGGEGLLCCLQHLRSCSGRAEFYKFVLEE